MDQLLKECIDKILNFTSSVDYKDKTHLNTYIAIYDKLKDIINILDNNVEMEDLIGQKLEEYKLEKEIIEKFGPSILAYLLMNTST